MAEPKIAIPPWLAAFQNRYAFTRLDDLVRLRCPVCGLSTTFNLQHPIKARYWKVKLTLHAAACSEAVADEEREAAAEPTTPG